MSNRSHSRSKGGGSSSSHSNSITPTNDLNHPEDDDDADSLPPLDSVIRYSKDILLSLITLATINPDLIPPPEFFHQKVKDPSPQANHRNNKSRITTNTPKSDTTTPTADRRAIHNRPASPSKPRSSATQNSISSSSGSKSNTTAGSGSDSWHNKQQVDRRAPQQQQRDFARDFSALGDRRRNTDANNTLERYSEWEMEQDQRNDDTFGDSAGIGEFDFGKSDFDPIASYKAEMRARKGERHLGDAPDAIAAFRKLMVSSKPDLVTDDDNRQHELPVESDSFEPLMNDPAILESVDPVVVESRPQGRFGQLFVDMEPGQPVLVKPSTVEIPFADHAVPATADKTSGSDQRQFQFLMSRLTNTASSTSNSSSTRTVTGSLYPSSNSNSMSESARSANSATTDPRLETSPSDGSFSQSSAGPPQPERATEKPTSEQLYQHQIMLQRQQQMYQHAQQVAAAAVAAAGREFSTPSPSSYEATADPVIQSQRRQHQFMLHHHQQQLGSIPQQQQQAYASTAMNDQELMEAMARERMAKKKAAALVAAANQMPTSVRRQQAAQHLPRAHMAQPLGGYPPQQMQHAQQQARAGAQMLDQLRNRSNAIPQQQHYPAGMPVMNAQYNPQQPYSPNGGMRPRAPLPNQTAEAQNALYSFIQQHQHAHPGMNAQQHVNLPTGGSRTPPPPMQPNYQPNNASMYGPPPHMHPGMYGMPPPPGMYGGPPNAYGRPYVPHMHAANHAQQMHLMAQQQQRPPPQGIMMPGPMPGRHET